MNNAKKIINLFGGKTSLSQLIGNKQSTVGYWAKSGNIPAKWQKTILEIAQQKGITLSASDFIGIGSNEIDTPDSKEEIKVFAKFPGELQLGDASVDCYVLNSGERVLSMSGTVNAIAKVDSGNVGNIVGIEALKGLIDKDKFAGETISFVIPGNPIEAKGITAEMFLELCSAYVEALRKGLLRTDKQKENAIRCSVLLASCAKVGLIALIDEATGYQYQREDDALRVKIKAFIAEELRAWEKTFPDELWEAFGRLTGWKGSLHSRPKWWGKLVIELIYETLDPDVAKYLKTNKPPAGIHWHRQLTENYGARQLVSRCFEIVGMAKDCSTIGELRSKVALHYGKEPVQLTLYLPRHSN
jgi:hypothetical protein